MAQYKVPQDVEADDKLIGPFSLIQFIYLLAAAGCVALAVLLFKVFPLLAIIPVLPALLFVTLALPLRKEQSMDTYLAAVLSFYINPRVRLWKPGQRETTIMITAPKVVVDENRTRNISGEEATARLSFLAEVVDSEGKSIKNGNGNMKDDFSAEADAMPDMFESNRFSTIQQTIEKNENDRHDEIVTEMRKAIEENNKAISESAVVIKPQPPIPAPNITPQPQVQPTIPNNHENNPKPPKSAIINLANDDQLSVQTIAKEAKRITGKDDGEVFISLH